jgi:hypothetical protein
MRTRQLRLNDRIQIQKRISEFLGKKINIVLANRTVMFGELKKVNETEIILQNMRMENVRYPFKNIVEIYLDAIV